MTSDEPIAVGWHPDPDSPGEQRYWDGKHWTRYTDDAPKSAVTNKPSWPVLVPVIVLAIAGITALYFFAIKPRFEEDRTAKLVDEVQTSMQHKFDTADRYQYLHLQVKHLTVIHKAENEYSGLATIDAANGQEQGVPVDITYDGKSMMWSIKPASLMFAIPDTDPDPATDAPSTEKEPS